MSNDLIPISEVSSRAKLRRMAVVAVIALTMIALLLCAAVCVRGFRSNSGFHAPWIYGSPTARFGIVEFGDLQCPYCRMYFPTLRAWINEHSDVNWEWRYLPLAVHEPAASEAARIAECSGEVGGPRLFWYTLEWLQQLPPEQLAHPEGLFHPQVAEAVKKCLRSDLPGAIVHRQRSEAARESITATPTIRLLDRETGRTLTLAGIVSPDVLSSAVDSLVADP